MASAEGANWMVEQLRELRDRFEFEVAAVVSAAEGTLVDRLRAERIPVHVRTFAFGRRSWIWSLLPMVFGLAWLFRRERFDVVQTHLFHSMVIGRIAGWIADVPVRTTMVAGPFHLEAPASRWVDRDTCWMDSLLIGTCEHTLNLYRSMGVSPQRLALVYYGSDERRFDPQRTPPAKIRQEFGWPPDTPLVGMVAYLYPPLPVGRWTPPAVCGQAIKGHEYLIRAVPLVLREFPKARFLLVGSGWGDSGPRYLEDLKALVRSLGVQESVVFTGFRSDVHSILCELDVSVQPSLNENLGGTIESLLMARPTVASRVGGLFDSIRDGVTGVLVKPANPEDLAEGIARLLRDPIHAQALGRAGRALMLERFTLSHTVSDLHALYDRLLIDRGVRRRGYRPWVCAWRLMVAVPVCGYLALRLVVVEYLLLRVCQRALVRLKVGV